MAETGKKKINYKSAWAEARSVIWGARYRLAIGSVLLLVSRLAGMVLPASMKYVGDEVFTNRNYSLLKWIALAIGVSTLISGITGFAVSQILGVAAQRAITEMRKRVQTHIERLPVSYFDSTQSGQLISRIMNDAEGIRNLVGTGLGQILGSLVTATIAVGVLFYLNWQLTAATMVVLLVFGGVLMYAFKVLRPIFRERGEITAEVTGRLGESLGGIRIVKAYTAEKREERVFARGAHRLFRNIAKSVTGVSAISSFSSVVIGAIAVVMIIIGGNAVQDGTMTLGDFLMYISFTFLLAMPVIELTSIGTQITEALAGLDRIREVLAMPTETDEDAAKESLREVKGEIEFQNVFFEYERGVPVLKDVSFHSPAGSTTALVGSSGSGKSTLLHVLGGLDRAEAGRIEIAGERVDGASERRLAALRRRRIGFVFQFFHLLPELSGEANVRLAGRVRGAHPDAGRRADELVERLGLREVAGLAPSRLSGGEQQRFAIARALVNDPAVVLADEPTGNLDGDSGAEVLHLLRETADEGRALVLVTHDPAATAAADRVLHLEGGRLAAR